MRRLILIFFLYAYSQVSAHAAGEVLCISYGQEVKCFWTYNLADAAEAQAVNLRNCTQNYADRCLRHIIETSFSNDCVAVYVNSRNLVSGSEGKTRVETEKRAYDYCLTLGSPNCHRIASACDGLALSSEPKPVQHYVEPSAEPRVVPSQPSPSVQTAQSSSIQPTPAAPTTNSLTRLFEPNNFLDIGAIRTGLSFGIGLIIALLAFAKRAYIANFIIHGNLPYKLPVYGEDIQCLFKRTQRINWYSRVVFGLVINLSMTHDQLTDVRKYWLGRVVAFDSLRRQRQNELAKMHFQLAARAKSDPHDKKNFWSRRWATLRTFLRRLFWIFAALFRLLFSFFFIRVNIAKLVRGTIIESKDLTLILQAKEAIEESATYLKEYLATANTFDGRDEVV